MYPDYSQSRRLRDSKSPLLSAALDYHDRGWTTFPLRWKEPAIPSWKHLRDDPDLVTRQQIRDWYGEEQAAVTGIAIVCGSASGGLAVRDYDDADAYHRWADTHPDLAAELPTVRTYRGYHVYCRSDRLQYRRLGRTGEYRATAGHYVAAPPSLHAVTGLPDYRWVVPLPPAGTPLPTVDPVAAGLLPAATLESSSRNHHHRGRRPAPPICVLQAPYHAAVLDSLPAGPGERNACLLALVRRLDAAGLGADCLVSSLPGIEEMPRWS